MENNNKGTKRGKNKKIQKFMLFYATLVSVLKQIMSKSVIYLLFNYQTEYIM